MNVKTQSIQFVTKAVVKGKNLVSVTTTDNQQIWLNEEQFDKSARTITFEPKTAGEAWKSVDGKREGVFSKNFNRFVGLGFSSPSSTSLN